MGLRTRMSAVQVIVLPNGTRLRLGDYCQAWKRLKTLPPETGISGWEWYPVEARHILGRLREGVHDRINRRGGLVIRERPTVRRREELVVNPATGETLRVVSYQKVPDRVQRELRKRIRHHCRWCGQPLGRYTREWERFCDEGCRRAHG